MVVICTPLELAAARGRVSVHHARFPADEDPAYGWSSISRSDAKLSHAWIFRAQILACRHCCDEIDARATL